MRDLDAVGIDELARCREAWGLPRHNAHWWNFRVAGHCRSTIRSGVTASTGRAPSGIVTTPRCHFPHFGVKTAEAPGLFDLPGTGYNGSNPRASSDHAGLAICDWSLGDSFWGASSGRRRRPVAVAGLLRRDERLSAQVCKPAKVRAAEYPASVRTSHGKAPVLAVVGTTAKASLAHRRLHPSKLCDIIPRPIDDRVSRAGRRGHERRLSTGRRRMAVGCQS